MKAINLIQILEVAASRWKQPAEREPVTTNIIRHFTDIMCLAPARIINDGSRASGNYLKPKHCYKFMYKIKFGRTPEEQRSVRILTNDLIAHIMENGKLICIAPDYFKVYEYENSLFAMYNGVLVLVVECDCPY